MAAACLACTQHPINPAAPRTSPADPLLQEQELRQTQGHHLIKCEVWDALALANQRLGAMAGEADALASGLKACRAGANSKDRRARVGGLELLGAGWLCGVGDQQRNATGTT